MMVCSLMMTTQRSDVMTPMKHYNRFCRKDETKQARQLQIGREDENYNINFIVSDENAMKDCFLTKFNSL